MKDTLICLFENKTSIIENDSYFSFPVAGVSLKAFSQSFSNTRFDNYVYRASIQNINEGANKQTKQR